MRSSLRLAAAALAMTSFGAFAAAQTPQLMPFEGTAKRITYDYQSGEITPTSGAEVGGLVTSFANTVTSGYFGLQTAGTEWYDWHFKDVVVETGGVPARPVCEFDFAYCTLAPDGAPLTFEIAFYAEPPVPLGDCTGGIYGGVGKGTQEACFVIAGLPGDTTPGDGIPDCYIVTVDVTTVAFDWPAATLSQIGQVGWSYHHDEFTGFGTGPLLIVAPNPCGPPFGAPPVVAGAIDCFDIHGDADGTPAGPCTDPMVCVGTFAFTTPGIASFYIETREARFAGAAQVPRNSAIAPNGGVLAPGATPPSVGFIWDPIVFPRPGGVSATDFIIVTVGPIDLPGFFPPPNGTLLCDIFTPPGILVTVTNPPAGGGPGTPFFIPIPFNCSLIGFSVCTQGGYFDPFAGFELTNALDITFGNF